MATLTETQLAKIGNFDASTIAALTADLNAGSAVDALAAPGALSLERVFSELSIDGTDAFTLAAPTRVNQEKVITVVAAANTPAGTLTITDPDDTAGFVNRATYFFDTVGQQIRLRATSALKWRCVGITRAGGVVDNVVVGTTAITNKMWQSYNLSVTGTVNSTLPNGTCVGERIAINCTTAALSPIGGLAGTFKGALAAAYTALGAIGVVASTTVTGDMALLEWSGTAWVVIYQTGCTLS
jgi:hypothetical protein